MNNIEVAYRYDVFLERLPGEIKKSNYKIQYFLDLLDVKRSFFYKKLKEKRFSSDEIIKISKALYPDEYSDYEIKLINKVIDKSRQEAKEGKYRDASIFLNEQKEKYGL